MTRLDIGIASYRNPEKLARTLASVERTTMSDWRCFILHNPSEGDAATREIIREAVAGSSRFVPIWLEENVGYAGAVNALIAAAQTEFVAYLDNDVEIQTPGWDERFAGLLSSNPEIGQVFPGAGHYGFHNGRYDECLWNAGYCWMIRLAAAVKVIERGIILGACSDLMDMELGHHEEVDLMIRLRMAGYSIGCIPGVQVLHHCSSTNDPASERRIHAGVVRWMNKWNRYFVGDALKYPNPEMGPWVGEEKREHYDPRMLRYTDWPPCALYLERMTLAKFRHWNEKPRSVMLPGIGEMDAVEILKPKGCYVGRAI